RRHADHREPRRAGAGSPLHRPNLLRRGPRGSGQHDGNAGCRADPGRGGVDRADDARRLVGAGSGLRPAAGGAGHPATRIVRPMKFWIGAAVLLVLALGAALSGVNEYVFFAGFVVLQFVVLATAWNILGGYAGYVNFGTSAFFGIGAYTAVVLFK